LSCKETRHGEGEQNEKDEPNARSNRSLGYEKKYRRGLAYAMRSGKKFHSVGLRFLQVGSQKKIQPGEESLLRFRARSEWQGTGERYSGETIKHSWQEGKRRLKKGKKEKSILVHQNLERLTLRAKGKASFDLSSTK